MWNFVLKKNNNFLTFKMKKAIVTIDQKMEFYGEEDTYDKTAYLCDEMSHIALPVCDCRVRLLCTVGQRP